jgi:cytochrome c biogenesis protein CcmG, thiol:disulfide interchange protein DsbE
MRGWWIGLALGAAPMAFAGEKAADFTLRDLNGQSATLSQYAGKVVVMSFWATWCAPCKEEMPHLQTMYNERKDKGLVVLSISTDDARSASRVKPYIEKMGYNFPVLLDRDSTVIGSHNPSKSVPYTVVVDRKGEVVQRIAGYNPGDEAALIALVDKLLAAP